MNLKALAAALVLAAGLSSVAVAQTAPNAAPAAPGTAASMKPVGQKGSNSSINKISAHLSKIIQNLENDKKDYGGNKSKALASLQQAQADLQAAIQYNQQHPNGP